MDEAIKKKWVKALRSGEFKQGTGYLKKLENDKPKHCCLGVLCEVLSPAMFRKKTEIWNGLGAGEDVQYFRLKNRDGSSGELPLALLRKVGMTSHEQGDLIDMNDDGSSFKRIATWIERNL